MTNLSVDVRADTDRVVVALAGELDMAEIAPLGQEFDQIEAARPPLLVVDLRGVTFIDSSGLRFVLEADVRARREARRVVIVPGPDAVHRVFLIALLDKRLDFIEAAEVEPGPGGGAPGRSGRTPP